MAIPSVKSYSELQRQLITAELGRRETATRKAAEAEWHTAADDSATAPVSARVLSADR